MITSPLEAALARLWSRILRVNDVGRNDDFLSLGGDSPGFTSLIASVNTLFGVDLKIESLPQDAMTVAGMARAIASVRSGAAADKQSRPTVIPRRQGGEAPHLSDTQRRMWFLAQLYPDDPAYNQSRAYRLVGEIDVNVLDKSVRCIASRHEILRTSYSLVDDEPKLIVHEDLAVEMKCADLREVPSSQQNEAVQALLLSEIQKPFELDSGPPWRMVLVHLSRQEHVLLRVAHHIVSDGWTCGIFERELSAAYSAFVQGREPRLPVLPVQYADYVAWQRGWLQGKVLETQLSYWRTQLAGLSKLDLPTDRPRPLVANHHGANLTFGLPAPLTAALKALGRHDGTTLFMKLVAAFQVLLYRYSGQEDIAVGMLIAGRKRAELDGLIGVFANTLVLRSDLSGNPSFRELLARVRGTALDAYTHQDLPFEKLVEELAPERDMSRNPLFQVLFVLQNVPDAALAMEGVEVSSLPLESHSAKFDLALSVRESAQGLQTNWEYASDLFDAVTVKRMAQHFKRLLEAIVADPERPLSELPLFTEAEKHQLLVEWNDTKRDYPKTKCIHELFEEQVESTPDAIAVVFDNQQLTYRELNNRANQLAWHLQKHGIKPQSLVGICVERSIEMVVAVLAVLKAGGAYLPLDPEWPKERLAFMLDDTQASVLLTDERVLQGLVENRGLKIDDRDLRSSILDPRIKVVCLDRDWELIARESDANPESTTTADNLAYVIYTSGSTGQPKGVQITHRSLLNLVFWHHQAFSVTPIDRATQLAGTGFDAAVWELWPYLTVGATIHIPDEMTRLDAAAFRDWLVTQAITISFVPTALAESLMTLDWPQETALRVLLTGGDTLRVYPPETLPFRVFNNYGPTECTVVTTSVEVWPNAHPLRPPTIGRPIANRQVYILDTYRNPVPIGVVGEIYIGGDGVASGYLNKPELTADKFIYHSFNGEPAQRLYKSGDLARYLPDGNIDFLGRADNQVKVRGYRIELGEIECLLKQHPAVDQSVALVREDNPGDRRLVAYVVSKQQSPPTVSELCSFLRKKMPEYMVPSVFIFLDTLPLTANGKVNRQSLPVPDQSRPDLEHAFVAARTAVEKVLAKIWGDILKLERVGIDDNFFELGGHSLLATQVMSRINQALRVESPLRTLFERPTIAEWVMTMDQDSDQRARVERRAQLFLKVDQLSDDQVEKMLDQKRSASSQRIT